MEGRSQQFEPRKVNALDVRHSGAGGMLLILGLVRRHPLRYQLASGKKEVYKIVLYTNLCTH